VAFYQLPAKERTCSAELWPDADVARPAEGSFTTRYKRWETFSHEARLALEAPKPCAGNDPKPRDTRRR
jgi:hypothetical protein